jgi:RimJ/RimL family protein N-acetyltransferase
MGAEYDRRVQSGWVFARAARGRGVASEAVQMAHDWLDAQSFGGVTVCGMAVANKASIRVAEKVGYRLWERQISDSGDGQTMKRIRSA